jgi:hypothetical protein
LLAFRASYAACGSVSVVASVSVSPAPLLRPACVNQLGVLYLGLKAKGGPRHAGWPPQVCALGSRAASGAADSVAALMPRMHFVCVFLTPSPPLLP